MADLHDLCGRSTSTKRRGARTGLNKSRLAERYLDEGMRMEDHPGIVFRDGSTGRRAAYRDEIDERVARGLDEADAAEQQWHRERAALT